MSGILNSMLGYREGGGALAVGAVILGLLAAFLLSHGIAWVYLRTHRGISYSGTMARSLVILSLIVALVMMVIGNNVARAFGLFGALALIRFRTPVKDANDTVFLFFAVAIGIAVGTGNILAGTIGTVVICLVLLYLATVKFGNPLHHDGLLRLHVPVDGNQADVVGGILNRYCDAFNLLHIREAEGGPTLEMSYQIRLLDIRYAAPLVAEIEGLAAVSRLSLLMQDTEATP
ncbi:MAG: DUF4956 domain-containing protein [bacterium]|nr:DUF4956 domain-containing protein [bacterium]